MDGNIIPNPDWKDNVPPETIWEVQLSELVSSGVKVSISIYDGENYKNFGTATQTDSKLTIFSRSNYRYPRDVISKGVFHLAYFVPMQHKFFGIGKNKIYFCQS